MTYCTKFAKMATSMPVQKRKLSSVSADEEDAPRSKHADTQGDKRSRSCPYLDTINRQVCYDITCRDYEVTWQIEPERLEAYRIIQMHCSTKLSTQESVLDFDFEKLCSVSLSHLNVYACLVCGKYFQGRGLKSHAYIHSVQEGHHVFLNLETCKFYCLPDNYQIIDQSLEDITYVLNPTFTPQAIGVLDITSKMSRAYDGTTYLPGIVGLNNIKANDYCNVILQALSHVPPLRNYFLRVENYQGIKRPPGDQSILLIQRFGELLRKLWNPRNFKAHVSPHEMLQAVVLCSKKKYQITEQGDCVEFMSWFLNALHQGLGGSKKILSSTVSKTFRGRMLVRSRKVPGVDVKEEERIKLMQSEEYKEKHEEIPWFFLTCDLPAPPLYPDELQEDIIPQVPIYQILNKFNGIQEKEYKTYKDSTMKRFSLTRLPPYIILFFKRFTKNTFIVEKNNTIVNFPVKGIDFGELLSPEVRAKHKHTTYDLIANIVHDGEPGTEKGQYKVQILHKGSGKWYEMQDLHVVDILPQMITLSESYVQIYEVKKDVINNPGDVREGTSMTNG